MIEAQHLALLEALGTGDKTHSGRTLLQHLKGTHDLLEAWGNPQPVCIAGLFHSIYGTEAYRHPSIAFAERERVRNAIGDTAEMLAYLFCVAVRDDFFNQPNPDAPVVRLHGDGSRVEISPATLTALVEIEVANTIEQIRPNPDSRMTLHALLARLFFRLFRRRITQQLRYMLNTGNQHMSGACRTALSDFIESYGPRPRA
jgi:hypothetical protein